MHVGEQCDERLRAAGRRNDGLVLPGPKCGRRSGETARGYATNVLRTRYRLVQILLGDNVEVAQ